MKLLRNRKRELLLIFTAALLVRICAMVVLEGYVFNSEKEFGWGNATVARYIVRGEGFSKIPFKESALSPTAITPPGYVYVIALVFSVFGINSIKAAIVLEIFQSIAAALSCVAIYYIGRRIDERVGVLAALGLAFYPPSVFFSVMRIGPLLHVVLLLILIMGYLLKLQERMRSSDAVICGILMGINALLEPAVIMFYVFGCVWLLVWSRHSRRGAIRVSAIMALVCIVVITPWMVRNYFVFDTFVPIKASLGRNVLEGACPHSSGVVHDFRYKKCFSAEEYNVLVKMDQVSQDKMMLNKALSFIKDHPNIFVKRTVKRIYYFWSAVNPYRRTPHDTARIFTYGPVLLLAGVGLGFAGRRWREISLIVCLFVSYPLPYYITHVSINRYKYVIEPFLVLLAAYAVIRLYDLFRERSREKMFYSVRANE